MTPMPPSASANSGTSQPIDTLKPQLKQVLGNLTVHLDDELSRYRRQIRGQGTAPSQRLKNLANQKKQLDLIDIKSQAVAPKVVAPKAFDQTKPVTPPPPPPNPFLSKAAPDPATSDAATVGSTVTPAVMASTPQTSTAPSAEEIFQELGSSHAVSANLPSPLSPSADQSTLSEVGISPISNNPERNLESSEELLKSLLETSSEPVTPVEPYRPGKRSPWLTPLNIGGLLLMLVGSLGVGYAIVNPSVLTPLKSLKESIMPSEPMTASNNGGSTNNSDGSFEPLGPDLSQREFVDLSLDSLSTLEVNNSPPVGSTPTTVPASGVTTPGMPAQPNPVTLPAVPNAPTAPGQPSGTAAAGQPNGTTSSRANSEANSGTNSGANNSAPTPNLAPAGTVSALLVRVVRILLALTTMW
jgi:hypothetical protein